MLECLGFSWISNGYPGFAFLVIFKCLSVLGFLPVVCRSFTVGQKDTTGEWVYFFLLPIGFFRYPVFLTHSQIPSEQVLNPLKFVPPQFLLFGARGGVFFSILRPKKPLLGV